MTAIHSLILENIRSAHNVGSILRTCDGLGVRQLFAVGLTPYPKQVNDSRLPHVAERAHRQIAKTALGAESSIRIRHVDNMAELISNLQNEGITVVALEQSQDATPLSRWQSSRPVALIVGNERSGVAADTLQRADAVVEIPMVGTKKSLNVSTAAAIAVYALCQP